MRGPTTPLILQMERAECGAACLAMILGRHGRWISLEEARKRCDTTRDGTDAANIIRAAQSYGLSAEAHRREPEDLVDLPLPQVVHWRFDHFVVLVAASRGSYTILDPAQGRRKVSAAEFSESFTGLTIVFEPGEGFEKGGTSPSVFAALLHEAKQSPDALAVSLAIGLLGIVPALALTGATGAFVDYVLGARQAEWIPPLVAILLAVVVVKVWLTLLHKRTVAAWKIKIGAISALRGFWRALTLPLDFFAQRSAGEVVSRLRLGSDVGGAVAGPLADALPQLILAAGYLAILAFYDPLIMLTAAIVALVNLAALTSMTRSLADRTREHQIAEGRAAAMATSGMANLEAYRTLGREELLLSKWSAAEDRALDTDQQLGRWRAIAGLGPVASGLMLSMAALVMGTVRALDGMLTLGDLVAVQLLAGLLNAPVASFASGLCQIHESAGALMRLSDLETHPQDRAFTTPRRRATGTGTSGTLRLENVSFGYSAGADLLSGINLTVEPGQLIAVVGPSGSGKSTLARIAAGLVDPGDGFVTLDGVALHEYEPEDLRRSLIYVSQEPVGFTGSIEDNVTLWDARVTSDAVHGALSDTGFTEVLLRRGAGARMRISGSDGGFSVGEMQRLALSRALSRGPRVLVLDETTSGLDNIAEAEMLALIRRRGAGSLIVTHRPGTAMRCDLAILVMGGGIAAMGPPQQILRAYADRKGAKAA